MSVTLLPGALSGAISAPPSKSMAHRLLICAALSPQPVTLLLPELSGDTAATARCLKALGAGLFPAEGGLTVGPFSTTAEPCLLPCGDSGATLRFLLPLTGALGRSAIFRMSGRLPQRPNEPLEQALREHGMSIERRGDSLMCSGRLSPGEYVIRGDISSQFVSGLLMALSALEGPSHLTVTESMESAGYVDMTVRALRMSGADIEADGRGFKIPGGGLSLRGRHSVEGDYSAAAFFLCAGALAGGGVRVRGLSVDTAQGDRAIVPLLAGFGAKVTNDGESVTVKKQALRGMEIDAAQIPDLVPALSVVAACAQGDTLISGAARLRYKESDRLASLARMLNALGGTAEERADGLLIRGGGLRGGIVETRGDHRIAMAAAIAACVCESPVTVDDGDCVNKSWPGFWQARAELGGTTA